MKRMIPLLMLVLSLMLASCGTDDTKAGAKADSDNNTGQTAEAEQTGTARKYNENMTEEQFQAATEQLVEFSISLGDSFAGMAGLSNKYADAIDSEDTFDWSQCWDFREIKAGVDETCQNILNFDDSECSLEFQLCFDELKSLAYETLRLFTAFNEEIDKSEQMLLLNEYTNVISEGMNLATVYHTEATIAFMEANNGDKDVIEQLKASISENDTSNIAYPSNSGKFTNKYGTSTTKCAHLNCTNYIASTGDTNCCVIHSNKCLNCGKYIDEDAIFCMDCLKGSINPGATRSEGCKYTYLDGSKCGKPAEDGMDFCAKHFNELYDTYESVVNRYNDIIGR